MATSLFAAVLTLLFVSCTEDAKAPEQVEVTNPQPAEEGDSPKQQVRDTTVKAPVETPTQAEPNQDVNNGSEPSNPSNGDTPVDNGAGNTNPGSTDQGNNNATPGTESPGSGISYKPYNGEVSQQQIDTWVQAHKAKTGENAGSLYRYAYIPNSFLKDQKSANYARIGLSKAINSVAVNADDIHSPVDVSEGHGIVFALDLRKYWGETAERKWGLVSRGQVKRIFAPAPRLDLRAFEADQPVPADRLTYNLLHGGVYNDLIETEARGRTQIRKLGAGEPTVKTAVKNAITYGPRYVQRREMPDGRAYWESFDQFFGRPGEIMYLTSDRLPRFRGDGMLADYGTVASEAWNHMKNGMVAYYIWGNANQERTRAEQSFVTDPLNHKGGTLVNGFCLFCHATAVQAAPNDIWTAIENGRVEGQHAERLKSYFTSNEELGKYYAKDRQRFADAYRKVVYGISDGDQSYNEAIISGSDEIEPAYYLVSEITGNRRGGNVKEGIPEAVEEARRRRGGGGRSGGGGW